MFNISQHFKHIWLPYAQMKHSYPPNLAKKTEGIYITFENGHQVIDAIASWWSVCHGYNHPYLLKIAELQLNTIPHVMFADIANKPAYVLASRLVQFVNKSENTLVISVDKDRNSDRNTSKLHANKTQKHSNNNDEYNNVRDDHLDENHYDENHYNKNHFDDKLRSNNQLNRVFFSDSGSTAVEVAMKIAVQYFYNQKILTKTKILSFYNAYHGDTMGGMSLCDLKQGMHQKFKNYVPQQIITHLPKSIEDCDQFEETISKNQNLLSAVIIEPLVQCAGGFKFHSPEILTKIFEITKKYNIIFILDECATGFFRTGKAFAFHHTNITPDIVIIGKALTGGTMTLAATMTTEEIFESFLSDDLDNALMHGPTFMGNPLACAIANASLDLFSVDLTENYLDTDLTELQKSLIPTTMNYSKEVSRIQYFMEEKLKNLSNLNNILDIRILGAIAVIELNEISWNDIKIMRKECIKYGVWLRPFSNVIYIMPPLIITNDELEVVIQVIYKLLRK